MSVRKHFDSITEFCRVPFVRHENASMCGYELIDVQGRVVYDKRSSNQQRWFGAESGTEAAARVTQGWPEGAARVLSSLATLEVPRPISVRRRLARKDQGDELDIHAVNRGDLDHAWTARQRRRSSGKLTLRLVVQTNLLAEMSAEELFWRGAAAVKFSDTLSEAGYSVEIIGALASYDVSGVEGDFMVTFPLKAAESALDIEALAGVVCNAGFHRIYGFRAYFALATGRHSAAGAAHSDKSGRVISSAQLDADGVRTFTVPYGVSSQALANAWLEKSVQELDAAIIDAATTARAV